MPFPIDEKLLQSGDIRDQVAIKVVRNRADNLSFLGRQFFGLKDTQNF